MTKPLRVASVGLGRWAAVLAEGVRRVPVLEIAGCFSRSEERRASFASKYGGTPYPSYEALLADGSVDAVLLTTPHSAHHAQILAAARAGKHVFCEKPLTLAVEDARSAMYACARAGVALVVGHCWRFVGAVQRAKGLIEEGDLGEVVQAAGHFGNPRALSLGQEAWRDAPEESPGGPLTGPGFHLMDVLHYLLGPVERANAAFRQRLTGGRMPDTALATLQFRSGALAHVSASFITQRCYRLALFGTRANAYLELVSLEGAGPSTLSLHRIGEPHPADVPVPQEDMIRLQMAFFARTVREGAPPLAGGREGLALVALLSALAASAESGRWETPAAQEG
ncbi:MAG: Gfo/Idh/MocA family oxidoreductase [Candidatus Tectomicrobia bacterium]|uniref:Gfo/Idh/MocA family oxidoreductase n=1 Tax=Tectimicrobiota bacterium TaxID=2528274 RepID=A0A932I029_UNCTE|nr:Gfo/Idh/MocA family oxidoreductase [Candidatus Tectomicrobia bacterium]